MKKFVCILLVTVILLSVLCLTISGVPALWAVESMETAKQNNILENGRNYNYYNNISREMFCELIYNLFAECDKLPAVINSDVNFNDTVNDKVIALNNIGIVKGKGENKFCPNDKLTREEAAVIITRTINKIRPLPATEMYFTFDDAWQMSDWAEDSIQYLCNRQVMQGVGDHLFAPQKNLTESEAMAILVRLLENYKEDITTATPVEESFADKLNNEMPDNKNYLFSPLSVKMALLMAANGAGGTTRKEILDTLSISDLEEYNLYIKELQKTYSQSELLKLNVSNSAFINESNTDQKFSSGFKKTLFDIFNADTEIVNNSNSVSKINSWVKEKTSKKIESIIDESNKDFLAMLVNAVYFRGKWENEFGGKATKEGYFTDRNNKIHAIKFMNKTTWFNYAEYKGIEILELPYQTRQDVFDEQGNYLDTEKLKDIDISMFLMISDKDFSPEATLKNSKFSSKYISLSVPKFKIEYSNNLIPLLHSVGIKRAFSEDADFHLMFDKGNMKISSVLHKTYINMNEKGTEAAAVTAVALAGSAKPPEPLTLLFNQPFTFVIYDKLNEEVLFMGEYAFVE